MTALALLDQGATFSEDRVYRYRLWRRWGTGPRLAVIGLNPSTADETVNDPTITRCIAYARRWGFDGLEMLNLFGFRATDPRELIRAEEPVGGDTNFHIPQVCWEVLRHDGAVLAAWGANALHPRLAPWAVQITTWLRTQAPDGIACLGLTATGQPKHPLYLPNNARPIPFLGDGGRLCRPGRP